MTVYELAAQLDFTSVQDFIRTLREMRSEATAASGEVEGLGDAVDSNSTSTEAAARSTNNFREAALAAGNEVRGFSRVLAAARNPLVGLTTVLSAVTLGYGAAGQAAAQMADRLTILARASGVTVTELSTLAAIGTRIDIDLQGASDLFRDFGEFLGEFALEGAGPAAFAYEQLGIQINDTNGQLRDTGAVFNDVIAALANVTNEAERSALAVQILGSDGNRLSPILSENVDNLDDLARSLGVLDAITSEEQANALSRVAQAFGSLGRSVGESLRESFTASAPAQESFFRLLQRLRPSIDFVTGAMSLLFRFVTTLGNAFVTGALAVQNFIIEIGNIAPIRAMIDTLQRLGEVLQFVQNGFETTASGIEVVGDVSRLAAGTTNGGTPNQATASRVAIDSEQTLADIRARTLSLNEQASTARIQQIDNEIVRQRVLIRLLETRNQQEIDDANNNGALPSTVANLSIAQNAVLDTERVTLTRLETEANEELTRTARERLGVIEAINREQSTSLQRAILANQNIPLPFSEDQLQERFDRTRIILENELSAERETLNARLNETSIFGQEREEILRGFDAIAEARRAAMQRREKTELVTNLDFQIGQFNRLEAALLTQQTNSFSNSLSSGASFDEREAFQRSALQRQIAQERQALDTQLQNFRGFEAEKDEIRREFEVNVVNRTGRLNEQLAIQNRQQVNELARPFTDFFGQLAVGYAQSANDGARSWAEVRDAAILNLQQILTQQLVNAGIQQALTFGLGLFGGGGNAAAAVGGAVTTGAVTSPTSFPQAVPVSGRSLAQNDSINANITIDVSGNNNNPAEVERAAQLGAERALNDAIDRRMAFQTRSGGLLGGRL